MKQNNIMKKGFLMKTIIWRRYDYSYYLNNNKKKKKLFLPSYLTSMIILGEIELN